MFDPKVISVDGIGGPKPEAELVSAPLLATREPVIYPFSLTPLLIEGENVAALRRAMESDRLLALFPHERRTIPLDAALPRTAEQVNRLAAGLDLQQILEGLATFCAEYTGQIWLEVLLCRGVNDSRDDLEALKGVLRRLARVDRVQLNTATRPPADRDIAPLDREALQRVADEIQRDTPWPCEIIASFPKTSAHEASSRVPGRDEVLELVRCHPSTVQGIAAGLDVEQAGVAPVVDALLADGLFECEEREGETYYFVREDETKGAQ